MSDSSTWGWVAASSALLSLLLFVFIRRIFGRWRGEHRRRRGLAAEQRAELLLRRAGFSIESHRPRLSAHVIIDGARTTTPLYGDLVVRKRRKHYLVEVKSGQRGSATRESTRRQLLEYWLNSDYDGVILVDTRQEQVQTIDFDYPKPAS